jgi:uroporphyrinogen-III synthase
MNRAGISGCTILLTRAEDDAVEWADRLRGLRALPIVFPCLECVSVSDAETRSELRDAVATADWLAVTSRRGALACAALLNGSLPRRIRLAAVGPSTANALRSALGRPADLIAGVSSASGLAEELARLLRAEGKANAKVVIAGAAGGRPELESVLAGSGASVRRFDVYRTIPAPPTAARRDLATAGLDAIWLASPSAVRGLLNRAVVPSGTGIITIGPTTSAAARAAGLTVTAQARRQDFVGLLEATL